MSCEVVGIRLHTDFILGFTLNCGDTILGGREANSEILINVSYIGAWLSERLRRWFNKPDVLGSILVTTEFFII